MATLLLSLVTGTGWTYMVFVVGWSRDYASTVIVTLVVVAFYSYDFGRWIERQRKR